MHISWFPLRRPSPLHSSTFDSFTSFVSNPSCSLLHLLHPSTALFFYLTPNLNYSHLSLLRLVLIFFFYTLRALSFSFLLSPPPFQPCHCRHESWWKWWGSIVSVEEGDENRVAARLVNVFVTTDSSSVSLLDIQKSLFPFSPQYASLFFSSYFIFLTSLSFIFCHVSFCLSLCHAPLLLSVSWWEDLGGFSSPTEEEMPDQLASKWEVRW